MVIGINHVTFSVRDLERSLQFYSDTLGMRLVARWNRGAYLLAEETWIALNVDKNYRNGPLPEYSHVAFTVCQEEMAALRERLIQKGAEVWQESRDNRSFYFTDPDGHKLELHSSDLHTRLAEFEADPPDGFQILLPPQRQV